MAAYDKFLKKERLKKLRVKILLEDKSIDGNGLEIESLYEELGKIVEDEDYEAEFTLIDIPAISNAD